MAYWFPLILGLSGTPLTKIMELLKVWAREATERAAGRPGPAKTLWILYPTCSLSAPWGGLGFLFLFNCSLSSGPSICAERVWHAGQGTLDSAWAKGSTWGLGNGVWPAGNTCSFTWTTSSCCTPESVCWVMQGIVGVCQQLSLPVHTNTRTDSTSRSLPVSHPSSMSPRSGSLHRKTLMVVFPLAPDHGRDFSGLCTWEHTQGPQKSLTADLGMSIFYLGRSSWNPLYHETSQLALKFSQ